MLGRGYQARTTGYLRDDVEVERTHWSSYPAINRDGHLRHYTIFCNPGFRFPLGR